MGSQRAGASTRQSELLSAIARTSALLLVVLLICATLDALRLLLRSGPPGAVALSWLYCCMLAGNVALLLALGLSALGHLVRGVVGTRISSARVARHAAAHGFGLLAAASAYGVLRPWNMLADPYHTALLVPALTWLGVVILQMARGLLPVRAYVAATTSAALGLVACDALVLPGLYRTFHNVAALAALLCAVHAASVAWPRIGLQRPAHALAAIAFTLPIVLAWRDTRLVREVAAERGLVLPRLTALVGPLADRDGDGFSPPFAGDCDDGDPAIYPGACEIAANGRDENCNGHVDLAAPSVAPDNDARVPRSPLPDVYLIVIDTLRSDFAHQLRERAMPSLARLSASALDFKQAYTPYPSTQRAMMALSTSRPHRYRSETIPPLPRWLQQAGYDAQLWVGRRRLRERPEAPPIVGADRRVSDPFAVAHEGKTEWTARMVDDALAELGGSAPRAPRLRWLHILDVHAPLMRGGEGASTAERYRAEIAFVDGQLARLLAGLERDEAGKRAAVIVLADHGEELGEHGDVFHGAALWQSSIKIPLLMSLPGVAPRSVPEVASLIDVLPTLAAYLGLPAHPQWHGYNWLGAAPPPRARVVSEVEPIANAGTVGIPARVAAVSPRLKVLVNIDEQLTDVYDLEADPEELQNLRGRRQPPERRLLEQAIAAWEDGADCVSAR